MDNYTYHNIEPNSCVSYDMYGDKNHLYIVWHADGTRHTKKVRVLKKEDFVWRVMPKTVGCDTGMAEDIIAVFRKYPAFAHVTFRHFAGLD